jgi:membrane associated rhomboid family serine protease
MTSTTVGMRCPECAKQRTKVRTARTMTSDPYATYVLMAVNILAFFGSAAGGSGLGSGGGGNVFRDGALYGPAIDLNNEYWRLVTSGFLHSGILHLAFNMYVLYWLGTMMEPALGRPKFLALYFTSMLAGSFGALLVEPDVYTVGASGAVFGLMGGAFVTQRLRGIDPMQSGIGPIILLNLALTFVIGNISIGGHIGGLIGGAIAAFALERLSQGRRSELVPLLACLVIAVLSVAGAIAVAGRETDQFAALLFLNGT